MPANRALSDQDLYLFNEGSHLRFCERLGAHQAGVDGKPGTRFAVWAPNAERVAEGGYRALSYRELAPLLAVVILKGGPTA